MKRFLFGLMILLIGVCCGCHRSHPLFETVSGSQSGIRFNNRIIENDTINPLDVVNIYNGGGVGIGDFNNDGLPDIYFGGNMVPGRLYLNKGHFKFEDVTDEAGVAGMGRWERGISVVDINNDGLMDIYICNTIYKDPMRRRNILYINQGPDKNGVPHFKDEAAAYGLDINVQSTMAAFFDYDNDGDLDMYLTVNEASNGVNTTVFLQRNNHKGGPSYGRLYRNDYDSASGRRVFKDVSKQAGIVFDGYGHAATICDINNDGWKDIYVSDDFISTNILYINNHDGTFHNGLKDYFKHTSFNAMGQDVVDINNDGLPDVVELDMNPEDNYRKKMMLASNSYLTYQNFDYYGYQYQYVRNTLQLNRGPRIGEGDSLGGPIFSEIGFLSGIAQTDWSWSPMVLDFDNDGWRDMVVTNGFPRDVSDHDFMSYREQARGLVSQKDILDHIPVVKLHNYAFRNDGNLKFDDVSSSWGLGEPTFSNGVAYADFDNDGAMDMVMNNINDEALLYRNTSRDRDTASTHYLQVKLVGQGPNVNALGATVSIYYDGGKRQVYENNPYRGYLSSMQGISHFGLGKVAHVDSVVVDWDVHRRTVVRGVAANQVLTVASKDAGLFEPVVAPLVDSGALFKEVTKAQGIEYRHHDYDFIDFDVQHTMPHKLSEYCPALAVGDIDGNGTDDLVIGGNGVYATRLLLQGKDGKFVEKEFTPVGGRGGPTTKDEGILLFDVDGDGDLDMYLSSGGYEMKEGAASYQDRLYINDGNSRWHLDSLALPVNFTSKFCVRAMDIDGDGDLDLFVSGRVAPWSYPKPVGSFIFRNDSRGGVVKFTDVTATVAPDLLHAGMVCDALFSDFDGDGQTDLVLAGEWMPVSFLKNDHGVFRNATAGTGIAGETGWWTSIVAGDFRHTGRMDYIVGNTGLNTLYQASDKEPVYLTAGDFDRNGTYIGIMSLYLPDQEGVRKEYPAQSRDDIVRQMPSMKKRFATYRPFALATMDEVLTAEQRANALRLKVTRQTSCYLRNEGGGRFTILPLPNEAQVSVVNGMVVDDFDGDGNLDLVMNGNDYGTEVGIGRYDAFDGLVLKGDGAGGFTPLSIQQSGICIPGNGRALVKLRGPGGRYWIAASQNKDVLKLYELKRPAGAVAAEPGDVSAVVQLKQGGTRREEIYYGNGFLSQSGRFVRVDSGVERVIFVDRAGKKRVVDVK